MNNCCITYNKACKCPYYNDGTCEKRADQKCFVVYKYTSRLLSPLRMPDGNVSYAPKGYFAL